MQPVDRYSLKSCGKIQRILRVFVHPKVDHPMGMDSASSIGGTAAVLTSERSRKTATELG